MLHNGLALNPSKSEVIVFGTAQSLALSDIKSVEIAGIDIAVSEKIKSLGVTLDKRLTFDTQVGNICKAVHYHARSLRHIRNSLPNSLAQTVASSIVSRLDYCNSLLTATSQKNIARLQRAQNTVARAVTRTAKFDHISPVLKKLHWLPVESRINFKI